MWKKKNYSSLTAVVCISLTSYAQYDDGDTDAKIFLSVAGLNLLKCTVVDYL
jgi:hypothetical protein